MGILPHILQNGGVAFSGAADALRSLLAGKIAGGIMGSALGNAAVAAIAAPIIWGISRLARRPALTHALWLLVLVKLVSPPIWSVPVYHLAPRHAQSPPAATPAVVAFPPAVTLSAAVEEPAPTAAYQPTDGALRPVERRSIVRPQPNVAVAAPEVAAVPAVPKPRWWRQHWRAELGAIWAGGSLLCLGIAASRIVRFHRFLRYSVAAPSATQLRAASLAGRLGICLAPRVRMLPSAVCPMLWAAGNPCILIPQALWASLDMAQRDTLLLHELAHFRRKDHWVRWLELTVTILYWWHPVCWWARAGLREAEEQCCDAWVLWALPGTFGSYASALLKTVEFVSVRQRVPVLASGMGQFGALKTRFIMLKRGDVSRALTWGGFSAACGVGAVLLGVAPTLARQATGESPTVTTSPGDTSTPAPAPAPAPDDLQTETTVQKTAEVAPGAALGGQPTKIDARPRPGAETAPESAHAPTPGSSAAATGYSSPKNYIHRYSPNGDPATADQLAASRAEIDQLRAQLAAATARLAALEASGNQTELRGTINLMPGGRGGMNPYLPQPAPPAAKQGIVGVEVGATPQADARSPQEEHLDLVEHELSQLLQEVRAIRRETRQAAAPQPVPTPAAR